MVDIVRLADLERGNVPEGCERMPSPLAAKMFLKPGYRAAALNAPAAYLQDLDPLPEGMTLDDRLNGVYDWIWHFAPSRTDLERDIAAIAAASRPGTHIWLSYRKGTRAQPSDVKRETLWEIAEPHGLEANRQVAVDATWSALQFKLVR
jgi:hypothetical protein